MTARTTVELLDCLRQRLLDEGAGSNDEELRLVDEMRARETSRLAGLRGPHSPPGQSRARAPGLVGRLVTVEGKPGGKAAAGLCEVVACTAAGEYGSWRVLVAKVNGTLLDVAYDRVRLVADPSDGPYR